MTSSRTSCSYYRLSSHFYFNQVAPWGVSLKQEVRSAAVRSRRGSRAQTEQTQTQQTQDFIMSQRCLRCLKFTMCVANLLCFVCGIAVLSFGIYMSLSFKMAAIAPSLASFNVAHALIITGIVITCLSFLGFLGALKENRCLLLTFFLMLFILMLVELTVACLLLLYEKQIAEFLRKDLKEGLNKAKGDRDNSTVLTDWDLVQTSLKCCGVVNASDWDQNVPKSCCDGPCSTNPVYYKKGCLDALQQFFEENFLTTGITVIILCIVEVLGMCFAMTLFCHISRTGLGYKF